MSQGFTIRQLTGSREWTKAELQRAHLDYALAGANTFELDENNDRDGLFDFLKSYGLDTLAVIEGNSGSGPPEWQAKEAIGRTGYLCPGIPAAREALLRQKEQLFKRMRRLRLRPLQIGGRRRRRVGGLGSVRPDADLSVRGLCPHPAQVPSAHEDFCRQPEAR